MNRISIRGLPDMSSSSGPPFFWWVGIKRTVPALIGFIFPGLRSFFSDVEDARIEGRSGELDLEEARNLCVLDGIFSMGYAIAIGLAFLGFHYLLFDVLLLSGGEISMDILILVVFMPLLATTCVELIDFSRMSVVSYIQGNEASAFLMGPVLYAILYVCVYFLIFLFFFSI
jgi:hypothetical protein